ncbi:Uncharacterized protein dnm_045100 [Desulfonema magnum]|uniref:Uncharacterized protein n=1 Tax=Desulfonema magnum TaxID=45655 RepID=A0A975BMX8_9BACT|nr:Uncharacterized protein dnm_045100 [Desulfonema magnum]
MLICYVSESTGKKDKKGKAYFPFLILLPCTFCRSISLNINEPADSEFEAY